jgi:putative aldouronate transport system substrate-binding protein
MFEKYPQYAQGHEGPHGNYYGIPRLMRHITATGSRKPGSTRTGWIPLGLEMPKTTDEFYNVMKAFKENDPKCTAKRMRLH